MELQKIQERIDNLFRNQIDQNEVKEFVDLVSNEVEFHDYDDIEDALSYMVNKQKEEVATFKCKCKNPVCESEPNRVRNLNFLKSTYYDFKNTKA